MNYSFQGLARSEAEPYLVSRLKAAGVLEPVFESGAVEAIFAASNGSVRHLNALASKALLLAAQKQTRRISSDLILAVRDDMALA
jgi:type II secretory pathway predicted ATPase ExeA